MVIKVLGYKRRVGARGGPHRSMRGRGRPASGGHLQPRSEEPHTRSDSRNKQPQPSTQPKQPFQVQRAGAALSVEGQGTNIRGLSDSGTPGGSRARGDEAFGLKSLPWA